MEQAVRTVGSVDAVTFHTDQRPVPPLVVPAARKLTSGPLILFETGNIVCDETAFDFRSPTLTPPLYGFSSSGAQ